MSEIRYDELLNIKTVGLREWLEKTIEYNRYEATPYKSLERLFQYYTFDENDKIVDFGCGRGRVAFYIHHRFNISATGVEVNILTFDEAIKNKAKYLEKSPSIKASIDFIYGEAENYEIKDTDNRFYFFNPFSINIFKNVINNILNSFHFFKRPIDIILYYPTPQYRNFMDKGTPFRLVKEIISNDDLSDKFLIYRLD